MGVWSWFSYKNQRNYLREKLEGFMRWLSKRWPWAYTWNDGAMRNLHLASVYGLNQELGFARWFQENEKGISWAHPRIEMERKIPSLRWWCLSTPWSSFLSSFSSPFFISHLFFLVLHSRRERGGGEWVECVREWVEVSWFSCLRSLLCADMWVQKERKEDKTHLKWFCWIIGMADGLRDHRFWEFLFREKGLTLWPSPSINEYRSRRRVREHFLNNILESHHQVNWRVDWGWT